MPQSLANLLVHLVFSTKGRRGHLRDVAMRLEMHRYLAGVSTKLECPTILVGGVEDHVHICSHASLERSHWPTGSRR